jgi:CheY-like chemotaxis protein
MQSFTGRILIVDDEEAIREIVRNWLKGPGIEIDDAADGSKALSMIKTKRYDVLITDMKMPGMSGDELIVSANTLPNSIGLKTIVMTGGTMADYTEGQQQTIRTQAIACLKKPFSRASIMQTLLSTKSR